MSAREKGIAYAVIGRRIPRLDGAEKATGRARFGADVTLPGLLWGKLLRSPLAHARLLRIDTSRADRLPGVKGIVTAADVRPGRWGNLIRDEQPLAREKVRWVGDRIAGVAAVDEDTAEEALALIEVEYDLLPPVLDPEAALAPDAPLIHEEIETYTASFEAIRRGNLCSYVEIQRGDVERGFDEADVTVEETFRTPMANQAAIEPCALLASVDATGRLTVWSSTQAPFTYRATLADILGLAQTRIRVIAPHVGGGFGSKGTPVDQAWVSLLAFKTGRPVKAVSTREEDFIGARPRHPSLIRVRLGARRDGTLVAGQARVILDTGATAQNGPNIVHTCSRVLFTPYRVPHVKVQGHCVYTNRPECSSMRAVGSPQACFAMEQVMDMLAERLRMDPFELRLKNAVGQGDVSPTGQVFGPIGLRETILRAREASSVPNPVDGPSTGVCRGRGIAVGNLHSSEGAAACQVKFNQDGTVTVAAGAVDIGQGSTTVIAQIVAEELGLEAEDVLVVTADTDSPGHDVGSQGSAVTRRAGKAALRAAADARAQLLRLAAERLEANVDDLELRDRAVYVRGSPQRKIAVRDIARATYGHGSQGLILGHGTTFEQHPPYDPACVRGAPAAAISRNFITEAAEVAVDGETGDLRVLKLVGAQDVGRAINRLNLEGQIEGGIIQGYGYALTEAVRFDAEGRILNPSFLDYKLPTALDQPAIDPHILEIPSEDGPFGARGAGEPPIIAVASAIANAVHDAIGVRVTELPITGERILAQLKARRSKEP